MLEQSQEPRMLGIEDYLAMLRRQRWVILSAAFVCWLVVWAVALLLPSRYESIGVVQIQQQQVSPKLVPPNTMELAAAQFGQVEAQILNPVSLQAIIDRDHLYAKNGGLTAFFQPSDPINQMQKDIQVQQQTTGTGAQTALTGFQISYTASNPSLAQAVDRELLNIFMEQNNTSQLQASQTTTSFLENQVNDAQIELNKQEAAVKKFKADHVGELPDQVQSNMQILSGLQQELQNNENAVSGAREQRLYFESVVQQYQSAQTDLNGDSAVSPASLDKQLKDLEMQLAQERSQYTDNYPDVIALKDQIAKTKELKKQTEDEIAAQRKTNKGSNASDAEIVGDVRNGTPTPMMQIKSQLKSNQLQIQSLETAQNGIKAKIALYEARLNAAPQVEQELTEISRGYAEASSNYDTLRQRWQDSRLAQNFPQSQPGLYSIASPASFPAVPSGPNHLLISLGGLAAGMVIGLAIAALLEFADIRIRKEADLEGVVSARVLVGIPKMSTPAENRRRAMLRWVERGAVFVMSVLVIAGNIYAFYRG